MLDPGSNRYSPACAALERDRCGAVPMGLPSDGFPRPLCFSQLIHIKGMRIQRDLYPRASFNAAVEAAMLNGLECYRFRTLRTFIDHVPIALVPRGSNVVLAHIPAVLSQAADAVVALGHRLYFEVQGVLRTIGDDDDDGDDDEPGFGHLLRSAGSIGGGSCSSSGNTINVQKPLTPPPGLPRTRSGSIGGGMNHNTTGASGTRSGSGGSGGSFSGGKLTAWMPVGAVDGGGGCGNGNGNGNNEPSALPNRRGSAGTASTCTTASSLHSSLQSFSSVKSSASSSFRTLRSLLSMRTSSNSSRALLNSAPEIDLTAAADPRVSDEACDDDHVTLMNGGCYSLDKLAIAVSVFADGEEGVQAFRQELGLRGVRVGGDEAPSCRPVRPCR
ncbi:hypothetical protein PLESTB_000791700 [Pleodorina starrii]|uniref:Uncharacterized protein n=1 Tax=Pleodorina starrii TaxID=330485 RepID=A0A9W6BL11_9CHLO|nr:hypothetical protein PLESTM_001006300 [Pleodorina starrii]GLC53828.1 hypothetical protein PLESTB_000791700 [Pleodorina starrii]GLC73008.1 hypothetical protein PLESTF_001319300 [Pleodorina starrii]